MGWKKIKQSRAWEFWNAMRSARLRLSPISGGLFLVFPDFRGTEATWWLFGTLLRRKTCHFDNYENAWRIAGR